MNARTKPFAGSGTQLDFFPILQLQQGVPCAKLFAFPSERMVGSMRDAAADILALPPKRQSTRLQLEVGLLRLRLQRLGISPSKISTEVGVYRAGIESEMRNRLIWQAMNGGSQDGTA
ncbi:DUF6074 family protein [Mesorhizobium sp. A556]